MVRGLCSARAELWTASHGRLKYNGDGDSNRPLALCEINDTKEVHDAIP